MSQEIEIEYKNLLTRDEFHLLLDSMKEKESFESWTQVNYYFDSPSLDLKDHGAALRIRIFNEQSAEVTLKIPHGEHLMEFNHALTYSEGKRWVEDGSIILPLDIQDQIEKMKIDANALVYQTFMTTHRNQFRAEDYLVVLDWSEYNQAEDYELEVEATSDKKAKQIFHDILEKYNLAKRPSPSKIARAFHYLNQSRQ